MTILVDSDILIEVSRGRDAAILQRWNDLSGSADVVVCSPVSIAELWQGALPSEFDSLDSLFRFLICIPLDGDTAKQAGHYLRTHRKSHALEIGDALIAAAATSRGAALWTRNRKHYPMKDVSFY